MTNESNQLLVIKAGQLIDGKSKNVKKDISIVINDNQIVDVKPSGELDMPEDLNYKLLDYSDKTLLPGLVDSHVHLTGIGDGRAGDDLATLPDEISFFTFLLFPSISCPALITNN
jgi:imidazolonepropionase-like amidohydrolase